ncbi:MAG: hypothetical protein L3J62_00240 [Gammaproteobacteria bacterium]|nr:hypothetical protein [Gammaproteobacteria bacterium]MCF6229210.1 hypothetical protein [Gammaproteobacteria bacterium]
MSPRVILYIGLVIALIPMIGMWQYMSVILAVPVESHDPEMLRKLTEKMAMLGMYSWPVWLGVAGFSVFRWHELKAPERLLAWIPMMVFLACYAVIFLR